MKMTNTNRPFRVGILGGMGPLAGIELHKLIVQSTPAAKDQDHMQVMLFTNPSIPDRTQSLRDNDGQAFAQAAGESVVQLEKSKVDVIVMACMTAHSRLQHIQAQIHTPILSGIPLVRTALATHYPKKRIALLATSGSIQSGVYTEEISSVDWLIPDVSVQRQIMDAIYKIKGGSLLTASRTLLEAMDTLRAHGAEVFVLGCTELGLLFADLQERSYDVIDPMRLMANQLVLLHELHRSAPQIPHNDRKRNMVTTI